MIDPKKELEQRLNVWLSKIINNIESIKQKLEFENYSELRLEIREQYRLIRLIRNVLLGKTTLQGWEIIEEVGDENG